MRVDLLSDDWEKRNAEVATLLGEIYNFPKPLIRSYSGLMSAVFETVYGLALFYSHKKNAVFFKGNSYAFQGVLPYLLKDGFQIQNHSTNLSINFQAISEGFKKDTNFALLVEDHPITGELFPFEEIEKVLNEKKVFCIRISHHNWKAGLSQLQPYSVRVCSVDPQHAFVQCGEKFKSPTMTTQNLDWRTSKLKDVLKNAIKEYQTDRSAVEAFESNLPNGWQKYFSKQNRLFDRAIIWNDSLNAEAVMTELLRQDLPAYQLPLPGYDSQIECVNFARWKKFALLDDWWEPLPTPDHIRGLLILGSELIKKPGLSSALQRIESQCRI